MPEIALLYHQDTLHVVGALLRQEKFDPVPTPKDLIGSAPTDGIPLRFGQKPPSVVPVAKLAIAVLDTKDLTPEQVSRVLVAFGTCSVDVDTNGKVTALKVISSARPTVTHTGGNFTVKVGGVANTLPTYVVVQQLGAIDPQEPDTSDPAHFTVQPFHTTELVLVLVKAHLPQFS